MYSDFWVWEVWEHNERSKKNDDDLSLPRRGTVKHGAIGVGTGGRKGGGGGREYPSAPPPPVFMAETPLFCAFLMIYFNYDFSLSLSLSLFFCFVINIVPAMLRLPSNQRKPFLLCSTSACSS